jgi:DNA-binding NarL/FixJ family response regulator
MHHLAPAVLCAYSGLCVMSRSAMETVLEERVATPCPLSEDQLLVLKLAAEDLPANEIAANVLGSRSKVYRAFTAIQIELGVDGLTQAIVIAARNGWI